MSIVKRHIFYVIYILFIALMGFGTGFIFFGGAL